MGGYGSFAAGLVPPFSTGVLQAFSGVGGGVGLPGVTSHVKPSFFGRGMPANGMGMVPRTGLEGQAVGMWSDRSMGGWGGEEQGGRVGDSRYGEDAALDHQYGVVDPERGGCSNEKEKDWAAKGHKHMSERRYHDYREHGWERGVPRENDAGADQVVMIGLRGGIVMKEKPVGIEIGIVARTVTAVVIDTERTGKERYTDHRRLEHEDDWDRTGEGHLGITASPV